MYARRLHDRVHGALRLSELAAAIAATPEFARLDGVRQLGACALVYPSATHTRREHSLGVAHLARRAAEGLRARYPARVSADDVLAVEIAGLVHDLGHGPLSHLFEEYVGDGWSHERMAPRVLDLLLARNAIDLRDHFSDARAAREFVALLVEGLDADAPWPEERVGRPADRRFLANLVCSRETGVDVDKLDYLLRDSLAVLGAPNALAADRVVDGMRVAGDTLVFADAVAHDLVEVFRARARLHRQVYQHHGVRAVERRLLDLARAADAAAPSRRGSRRARGTRRRWRRSTTRPSSSSSGRSTRARSCAPRRVPATAPPAAAPRPGPARARRRRGRACSAAAPAPSTAGAGRARAAGSSRPRRASAPTARRRRHAAGVAGRARASSTRLWPRRRVADPHGRVWLEHDPLGGARPRRATARPVPRARGGARRRRRRRVRGSPPTCRPTPRTSAWRAPTGAFRRGAGRGP